MRFPRAVSSAALLLTSIGLCGPLCSCVEIRITSASVVSGPGAGGTLTIQLEATLSLDESMQGEGEDAAAQEPTRNAIGYVAVGLPARMDVQAVRLVGSAAMVGDAGSRPMGEAPQVARIYDTEFPDGDVHWVAFHVILDEVDLQQPRSISLQLDLSGAPTGVTTLWVAPGSIDDATTNPDPVGPTRLELAVGADKATIRVIAPAGAPGKGVTA